MHIAMTQGVFITYDTEKICTYLHKRESVAGKFSSFVC